MNNFLPESTIRLVREEMPELAPLWMISQTEHMLDLALLDEKRKSWLRVYLTVCETIEELSWVRRQIEEYQPPKNPLEFRLTFLIETEK